MGAGGKALTLALSQSNRFVGKSVAVLVAGVDRRDKTMRAGVVSALMEGQRATPLTAAPAAGRGRRINLVLFQTIGTHLCISLPNPDSRFNSQLRQFQ